MEICRGGSLTHHATMQIEFLYWSGYTSGGTAVESQHWGGSNVCVLPVTVQQFATIT